MVLFSTFNFWLFATVHGLVGQFVVLDYFAIFFADYIQYLIAGVFLLLLFGPGKQQQNRVMVVMAVIAAFLARYVVKSFILLFVAEPRPFVYWHFIPLITVTSGEEWQSFPSGHAIFFFALAMTVFCFNKTYGIYLFAAAIAMGVARIYTGVHWPMDIICGAVLGMGVGGLVYAIYRRNAQYITKLLEWLRDGISLWIGIKL